MMRPTLLLVSAMFSFGAQAQDLTGTWVGYGGGDDIKLVLVRAGDEYVGYASDDNGRSSCKTNFSARFRSSDQRLRGGGHSFIHRDPGHVLTQYDLTYSRYSNHEDRLSGTLRLKGALNILSFGGVPVELKRISRSVDTTVFMQRAIAQAAERDAHTAQAAPADQPKQVLGTPSEAPPAVRAVPDLPAAEAKPAATTVVPTVKADPLVTLKKERQNAIVQELTTASREITLQVYDNGLPDGDTISILHNERVVADHRPVTVSPQSFTLTLHPDRPVHDITLIAHNLGTVAPNTATVVIEAGGRRYRLTASTDLQQNAVVRVRLQP